MHVFKKLTFDGYIQSLISVRKIFTLNALISFLNSVHLRLGLHDLTQELIFGRFYSFIKELANFLTFFVQNDRVFDLKS